MASCTSSDSAGLASPLVAAPDARIDSVDPATLEIGAPVRAVFQALAPQAVQEDDVVGHEACGGSSMAG